MMIGLRGVGKTVLLNRYERIAEQEGMKVAYLEATETGDFSRMLATRLRKVLLGLSRGRVRRVVNRAMGVLKSFTLQLPDGTSIGLGVEAIPGEADSGDLSEDLTDVLVSLGQAARECGTGLAIAVDEVQYLSSSELGALIAGIHRINQLELPVVLVGAGLPQLPGLVGEAKTYAERLFEFHSINSLALEDAVQALVMPAAELDVDFAPAATDLIFEESHGYPYFLQEWGYHVWNRSPGSPISRDDAVSVHEEVISKLDDNFFLVRMDRLTPRESQYLRAMAELGPGPHRSGAVAGQLGARVEAVASRRSMLIKKGMIYSPAHGYAAFTVPLFDSFLRRKFPL